MLVPASCASSTRKNDRGNLYRLRGSKTSPLATRFLSRTTSGSESRCYPQWQAFLRAQQPATLIIWGKGDIFFTPEGGTAYLRDLTNVDLHLLDSGHFVLEDQTEVVAFLITRFYQQRVAGIR